MVDRFIINEKEWRYLVAFTLNMCKKLACQEKPVVEMVSLNLYLKYVSCSRYFKLTTDILLGTNRLMCIHYLQLKKTVTHARTNLLMNKQRFSFVF